MKTLICIAPDGDFVREGQFDTIEEAWDHSNDMGSRWYFYPIHLITGETGKRIVAVPDGMPKSWVGRELRTLRKQMAMIPDEICHWINGLAPCPL